MHCYRISNFEINIRNVILLIVLNEPGLINSYKLRGILGMFRSENLECCVAR